MLPNITFVKGSGGLGRPLAGQDHFSALVFYAGTLPSGFTTNSRIKKFFAVSDAEAAGIKLDYADETKAAGTYLVTAVGANGDTINIKVAEPNGIVDLGTYTKAAGQTTATAVAAAIAAIINAGTSIHGYTATAATGTVTITARPGLGIFLNAGTPITVTIVGTIAGTLTQFTGGAASRTAVYHYHISEFFRLQPKGVLWVGIFAVPGGAYDFQEITTIQNFSSGVIRRVGIYKDSAAFSTGDMTVIQGVLLALEAIKKPLIAIYAGDLSTTTDISTLSDLNTFDNYEVSPCIAQDGGGVGALLYQTTGKSITVLGAQLGASALAKVNESIAWVQKFNISNGIECEAIAFANGKLFTDASVTDGLLNTLDQFRYVFLRKFVGQSGTYFNGFNMACSVSSDYAYGEDNLTIQKAIRGVYASLLPALSGPLELNADGTLSNNTIAYLETLATPNLDQMVRDSEISAYGVQIDTAQNVLTTGKIIITVQLVQQGVARQIQVPIGYTTSL